MDIYIPPLLLGFLGSSKYALLFVGTILEGPVVMMVAGFLYHLGQFAFLPMYLLLMAGDLVGDIVWYAVGYYGAGRLMNKYGKYIHLTPQVIEIVEDRFKRHQNKILIISKLTMGFGFALATLVVAGMLRVPFKRYLLLNILGGFIWTLFAIGIGYVFGNVYSQIQGPLRITFALIGLICAFFAVRYVNRYLTKQKI